VAALKDQLVYILGTIDFSPIYFSLFQDNSKTGYVSYYKMRQFMDCFGTLKKDEAFRKVQQLFRDPYFFGYLSSNESKVLLSTQNPGTFLLRFRQGVGKGNTFAISVVNGGQLYHYPIYRDDDGNLKASYADKLFLAPSVQEIIAGFQQLGVVTQAFDHRCVGKS
jgi:hypothetical protein